MIFVEVFKDTEKLATRSYGPPKSASMIEEALKKANVTWVGELVDGQDSTRVYFGSEDVPEGTYRLNLQQQAAGLGVDQELAKEFRKGMQVFGRSCRLLVVNLGITARTKFMYSPSVATVLRDPDFKLNLIQEYQPTTLDSSGDKPGSHTMCMVLGVALPTSYVIASHIFKYEWKMSVQHVLGFANINDVRNGLLLARCVEEALDSGFLCFLRDHKGEYRVRLLSSELKKVGLLDVKAYPWIRQSKGLEKVKLNDEFQKELNSRLQTSEGRWLTFGDLEDRPLQFSTDARPFKRCLAFHATQCMSCAIADGRMKKSDLPEMGDDSWSGPQIRQRVQDFLATASSTFPLGPDEDDDADEHSSSALEE